MSARLLVPIFLACALVAQAQGTLQFSVSLTGSQEVPSNNDPTVAMGVLSLTGDILNFSVDVPGDYFIAQSAYIQGPASLGTTAPIIFDLGTPVPRPGNEFQGPSYLFFSPFTPICDPTCDGGVGAGPFTLTAGQIQQLMDGLWYVNVTSAWNPDGEIRGQILLVPEPTTLTLLGFGICSILLWRLQARAKHGYLSDVLPRLGDWPITRVAELTPTAWQSAHQKKS